MSHPPRPHAIDDPENQELFRALQRALGSGKPLDLLVCVSSLLDAVDPRSQDQLADVRGNPSLDQLIASFIDTELAETTAALTVMRTLHPALPLAPEVDAELAARTHAVPSWIHALPDAAATGPAHTVTHGDGTMDHLLGVTLDETTSLTTVVVLDTTDGTVADAVVLPVALAAMAAQLGRQLGDDRAALGVADPGSVRSRLTDAVTLSAAAQPPTVTPTWPICRPLVEWFVRLH